MCGQTEIAQTTPEVTAEALLEETAKWFETHKWGRHRFYNGGRYRDSDGAVDEAEVVGNNHIPTWNDETAKSADEVITALRAAAPNATAAIMDSPCLLLAE